MHCKKVKETHKGYDIKYFLQSLILPSLIVPLSLAVLKVCYSFQLFLSVIRSVCVCVCVVCNLSARNPHL